MAGRAPTLYIFPTMVVREVRTFPAYLQFKGTGEIRRRAEIALRRMQRCTICPRVCGANRLEGEIGECQVGRYAIVASYGPHYGEEPPLVGRYGSGTVFFSGCSLRCVFCQNYEISQFVAGTAVSPETLARIFLRIQDYGCHNLNLVTPTHNVPQILEALAIAVEEGLEIPIVYNTSGYDSVATLRLLEGIVDIYMPDIKYWDNTKAERYSGVRRYREVVQAALKEMHRQVGDLVIESGLARRGLLIRHLVLPHRLADSFEVMRFIAEELSRDSWVNIMDQYYPTHRAFQYPELSRRITSEEYEEVVAYARKLGLHRGIPFDYL